MDRPESITTGIVRETMNASLDDVNDKLTEAEAPELTEHQLARRRQWVKRKAAQDGAPNGQSNGHAKTTETMKTAQPDAQKKRKRNIPRPGSMSEFVCSVPFDMPSEEVWKMALEAGYESGPKHVAQARWKFKNLRKRFAEGAAKGFSAADRAAAIKLGIARRLALEVRRGRLDTVPTNAPATVKSAKATVVSGPLNPHSYTLPTVIVGKATPARAELAAVIMRVGLDLAEEVIAELRSINQRFAGK